MADQNKFEKMLELLVNEDKEAAQELFHEIVVEKSRDIYEGLLEDEAEVEEATDEEVDEATDEEVDESKEPQTAGEQMREYVEKVSATMGDNGANTKSTVANKNDMGGTASNLNQAGTEAGVEANKGNLKGSALSDQNAKDMNTKNINVPGGKAAKAGKTEPGHGAEKKGKPETAANKKPTIGG
jgi:hypothetical protein